MFYIHENRMVIPSQIEKQTGADFNPVWSTHIETGQTNLASYQTSKFPIIPDNP